MCFSMPLLMCFSMPLLGASGTQGFRRGRSPCPDALLRVGDDRVV